MIREPEECLTMAGPRAEIDRIDRDLIAARARRAAFIDRAAIKRAAGLPARIDAWVGDMEARARATAADVGLDPELVEGLRWRPIDGSIAREDRALDAVARE